MTEVTLLTHPRTELSEARFTRAFTALAIIGGAALGVGTAAQEILNGGVDNTDAVVRYLAATAVEVAAIPAHLHARRRGQTAQQQLQETSAIAS